MPSEILKRFKQHDSHNQYRNFEEKKQNHTTQTGEENPQAEEKPKPTELSEPELAYIISLLNRKWWIGEEKENIRLLHERANFTAKSLTMKLVESFQPICYILGKHDSVDMENVTLLLYRL